MTDEIFEKIVSVSLRVSVFDFLWHRPDVNITTAAPTSVYKLINIIYVLHMISQILQFCIGFLDKKQENQLQELTLP